MASARVKWISDLDKNVLTTNFEKRGWVKGSSGGCVWVGQLASTNLMDVYFVDGDWNFYW